MANEIEAKLRVLSLDPVRRRLVELGARRVASLFQVDRYYDDSAGSLIKGDIALRIRQSQCGDRETITLSGKGPAQESPYKKRLEVELAVQDADAAEQILSILGYRHMVTVRKNRQSWRLGACKVELDEPAGLGFFVEIEGADEQSIASVRRQLGLDESPHVHDSYAYLTRQSDASAENK